MYQPARPYLKFLLALLPLCASAQTFNFVPPGGAQMFTASSDGVYHIVVNGASGGAGVNGVVAGGAGAQIAGDFTLNAGQVLKIYVGQQGSNGPAFNPMTGGGGGGGGGTFVVDAANTALIIAGGGGGGGSSTGATAGGAASTMVPGMLGGGGTSNTANGGGGGGGFTGDGVSNSQICAPFGGSAGGAGGARFPVLTGGPGASGGCGVGGGNGGYGGGGGGGSLGAGGGGGAIGGNGVPLSAGTGGGSFVAATADNVTTGTNTGSGSVMITLVRVLPPAALRITDARDSAYQVRYASNLAIGDSVINLINNGAASGTDGLMNTATGFQQDGQICANIYAYSPDEQLVSCCSCNVTPNGLNSLSAKNDLASNTLTPIIPSALVIKIVATAGGASCTASTPALSNTLAPVRGLMAWGTTIHALPVTPGSPATSYGAAETAFSLGSLSTAEWDRMAKLCAFIRANGSGYGICKSCKIGGLAAVAK